MSPNSWLSRFSFNLWLTVGMIVILTIIFVFYTLSEKEIDRANDRRHVSFLLADELRQSSDDLTKMARLYVVTGNPIYKKYFRIFWTSATERNRGRRNTRISTGISFRRTASHRVPTAGRLLSCWS
jgi:hypothetical protein